jgi:hypothetical protein
MLCTYEEHGPQHPICTLDRSKVVGMLEHFRGYFKDYIGINHNKLVKSLEETLRDNTDEQIQELDGIDITDGWGELQFYVIKLV